MKPITFESIRNLLKTKKKQKDKSSIDQSFKRSDSFKRISIRKSYLERGRKRNAAAVLRSSTKNLVNINEFENQAKVIKQPDKLVKSSGNNEAGSSSASKEAPSRPVHELTFEEKLESNDASLDEKIRALQEINDRYISENQNLVEKNFEAIKYVEKVKIKKPPRPSKQGLKKARENEIQNTNPSDLKTRSSESVNTLTSNDTIESNSRAKNISHVSITTSDVIPEEDESTIYSYEPETLSTSRKAEDADDKSFYSISTFTIESNTMNNTNASSRKSFRSSFSTSTKTTELPTLVTIKTYCEPNACIQSTTHVNERYLETSFDSYPEDTLTHNASKSDILPAKSSSLNKAAICNGKSCNDTKTSSLKDIRPKINTQTFKMIRSKSREGIVIRIPAIDNYPTDTNEINNGIVETENLNRQLSNDSALDLIDVDIKVDEKDMRNKVVELKNQKNKYKKKLKKAAGKTATLDIEDCRNHTFKSHENFELERGCPSKERPEPKFIFPSKYFEEENNIFYDQTVYDETEIPSPENSIPYALRIKENPFTKNKEFYSINTGRIWKQLNLGQEEDLSILSAAPRLPVPKTKNESFKSMSSRDSGFSLTLTKPKNLFRRKSKKATLLQRRKPKLAVSKDGYFKRVMIVQRNSSKRKRSLRKARMQSKDIFRELYDENWVKLGDDVTDQQAPDFARDFENFCNNRRYNQRINDLEAFYEEHLKRLRHYYIQKKKMNEAAIKEFYKDYNGEDENDLYDSFVVSRNNTMRFKNHIQRKYFQEKEAENSMEFIFPHPDKRKTNGSAVKQKVKGKRHLFHEVRPCGSSVEPSNWAELELKEMEIMKELLKLKRSSVTYDDANFQLLAPTKALDELQHRKEGQVREISLASIFPSVDGKVKSGQTKNIGEEEDDDGEFSENEFLINSIGENLYCVRCDKVNSDCECYDDTTETTNDNSNDNYEEDECGEQDGKGDDNVPDDDDENYCDVHEYKGINIVHVNHKKKVKRKKSKKRVRKNHSTLRRGSYWGDITQKGYEKKRTRLLQPYSTKNAQQGGNGGGGGNNPGYVNDIQSHLHHPSSQQKHNIFASSGSGGGGGGGGGGSRERDDRPSGHHHQQQQQIPQNRTRRSTQRRVTHNQKRYHSAAGRPDVHPDESTCQSIRPVHHHVLSSTTSSGSSSSELPRNEVPSLNTNFNNLALHSPAIVAAAAALTKSPSKSGAASAAVSDNDRDHSAETHVIMRTKQHQPYVRPPAPQQRIAGSDGCAEQLPPPLETSFDRAKVRQEAVQQALAALKNRPKPSLPMPSKRSSVLNRSPERDHDDTDSSTDDESIPEEGIIGGRISTPDRDNYNLPRDHILGREPMKLPSTRDHHHVSQSKHQNQQAPIERRLPQSIPTPNAQHATLSDTSSAGSPPAVHRTYYNQKNSYDITDITEYQPRPYAAPDITQFSANTRRGADRVTRYVNLSNQEPGDTSTAGRWKVSAKIQQLLNTLKRPKRRPLPEFYEDNDIELEIAANPKDPNAPKPEGSVMTSVQGEQLIVPSGLPRTLEAALQRYGTSSFKAPMATVLDPNGKMTTTLTYGKLLSRAQKIAYALSTKVFSKGPEQISLKPGDRVALVYPNSDPLSFLTAWYGCMFRGLVPLPIELPLSSSDSPPQQVGFLLSSCGVQVALTSEACLKGLPKSSTGEVAKLKGWPRLHWFVTEHLPKVPKDFNTSNNRISEDSIAYIEYTTDKEGSVMGVTVTRQSMINHCRALTMACHYTEGETTVCVLDFKREVGLWHSILTSVLNGMHVLFIPYALMKLKPSSWMQLITKYRASCCLVKSRDLHWGLLATKDHKEISLSSLRMLLVADGANPWSLSSCDQFLSVFQSKGLRADAICPCASSSEVFTVSLRRPGRSAGGYNQSASGRGVLSMAALSHGVVRVDSEDSLTSLTLQDCGQVMPSATMVVVNAEGPPVLCKTDQVGEICVTSGSTGTTYFGLDGMTNATFKVQPLTEPSPVKEGEIQTPGKPIGEELYVRSGLLGFLGPGGLVFVCGSRDGLMTVTGRKHNADDIIATVLAVEPVRFIYRGRIAVFSIKVLRDERVCVIAEQRPDCSEEESFQWMSRVLQAVDSIHQVGIYCLALVPPNHLPKTPLGGIHLTEARRRFLEGSLHPANVLMCPHTCVTNLPKPRELHHGSIQQLQISGTTPSSSTSINTTGTDASVGPASVMVGNLVQGNRLASAQGRDIGLADDNERKHQLITGVLRWRANSSPDHVLYTLLNSKGAVAKTLTCSELHKRAEKIAALLQERGKVSPGDHVALIFPPGLDLICAFYGCLYLGAVPVTIRPPHPQNLITTLPTVRMIVDVSKSGIILSIQSIIKLLKSREAATSIDPKSWPVILDIEDNPKRKLAAIANSTLDSTAYLDFSVSTCGRLSGVIITHRSLSSLCASLKLACELYPSRHVALCLDPYCGLGFSMWTLISVYSGHHSILIAPYEVEANPSLWLSTLSQYRVRDTFCSYGVIELCTKALSNSIQMLKQRNVNLGCVRTCVVVAEERPRVQLTQQFCKLFQALGLNTRCVSTSFGCRVNPAICVQGASSAESAQVYVDLRALRNNRVALVERGAPNSLCLVESGKLLPGVKVIIANPDSKGQCGDSHLGEIWVQSPHSSNGYFTIYGDETDYNDHFNAKLVTGCSISDTWARTGYLGFLRRTECSQAGSILDETTPSIASRDSDNESIHSQGHNTLNSTTSSNAGNTTIGGSGNELELHDAVYIVGALDEVITLRGMYYHPIDIENSVLRCHKKIAECAVFTWTNLLVVVVELDGNESEALDLVPLVTNTVLEEHQLIVGVVVVVDPGVVPINSRGEKQRMHLRDGFLADQLDPIYVAYNM
ncbi:disco-interacting protein 2 isoform X3 [Malaya genurostris]|uniref:disco-interacting protein 2 isoform X3 n=1 Tax=Malaya genurostris TaxID=325434 RepID=UPI0026F3A995|nr:disco-interacting protein 2 isoform X3 [Malaya genurostris]